MIEIIPAVIPSNLNVIREKFSQVVGITKKVQMDIVDGVFAPPTTWPFGKGQGDELLQMVRGEEKFPFVDELLIEVDMLILHPIETIPDLLTIGIKSFVVHIDSTDHVKECIETIKNAGRRVGIALKPSIDLELLQPYILDVDFVQFMGNDKVGYNGVNLDEQVLEKIKEFHEAHPSVPIQIDIGVNFETAHSLVQAGATSLISGSAIWNSENISDAIIKLQNS